MLNLMNGFLLCLRYICRPNNWQEKKSGIERRVSSKDDREAGKDCASNKGASAFRTWSTDDKQELRHVISPLSTPPKCNPPLASRPSNRDLISLRADHCFPRSRLPQTISQDPIKTSARWKGSQKPRTTFLHNGSQGPQPRKLVLGDRRSKHILFVPLTQNQVRVDCHQGGNKVLSQHN